MGKSSQVVDASPSTDTTPIEFNVGGVEYRVPRNFIITMDNWAGGSQGLVTLRVNIADMKPMTEETRQCFSVAPLSRSPGCEPFNFLIEGKPLVSADEAFKNMRHLFRSQIPERTAVGYEKYEVGPENAGTEYYRKVEGGQTRLYACQVSSNQGRRDGVCRSINDALPSGGAIHFFFRLDQLLEIEGIDDRLRDLAEAFTPSGLW